MDSTNNNATLPPPATIRPSHYIPGTFLLRSMYQPCTTPSLAEPLVEDSEKKTPVPPYYPDPRALYFLFRHHFVNDKLVATHHSLTKYLSDGTYELVTPNKNYRTIKELRKFYQAKYGECTMKTTMIPVTIPQPPIDRDLHDFMKAFVEDHKQQ